MNDLAKLTLQTIINAVKNGDWQMVGADRIAFYDETTQLFVVYNANMTYQGSIYKADRYYFESGQWK